MSVDATTIAREQLHKSRTFNMVIMGAMLRFIPGMTEDGFAKALEKSFGTKYAHDPELKELNEKAFRLGYDLTA